MSGELLAQGDIVVTKRARQPCEILEFIGGGGQGEVYRAMLGRSDIAVKWYFPTASTESQRLALGQLVRRPAPSTAFLWPLDLADSDRAPGFGYVMALRPPSHRDLNAVLRREVELPLTTLATLGMNLSDAFLRLHSEGLCYRDISPRNVFFDPESADILICDNDNVGIDGTIDGGVLGTPRFMAPEVVRREALPSSRTDLWSLAVLLFSVLCLHHPLEGLRELELPSLSELTAARELYGDRPVFIFDPRDESNRPHPTLHRNAIVLWPFYPPFIRELFTRSFTEGIYDPVTGRVRESEWRTAMARLRDCVVTCSACGVADNYLDPLDPSEGTRSCWHCGAPISGSYLEFGSSSAVMLRRGTAIYGHHLSPDRLYDFTRPLGIVQHHPSDPRRLGLTNRSEAPWVASTTGGTRAEVPVGATVGCSPGTVIDFGEVRATVRQL